MADDAMTRHQRKIKLMHEREAKEKQAKQAQAKKKPVVEKPKPKPVAKPVEKAVPRKKATLRSSTARKNSAMEELFGYMK